MTPDFLKGLLGEFYDRKVSVDDATFQVMKLASAELFHRPSVQRGFNRALRNVPPEVRQKVAQMLDRGDALRFNLLAVRNGTHLLAEQIRRESEGTWAQAQAT